MELKSLVRGWQIVELFTYRRPVLTFDEICAYSSLPKSTLYRFLENLTRMGLLKANAGTKEYRLGPSFIRLGEIAQKGVPLLEDCFPMMRRLSAEIGESVYLSMREGDQKVCVSSVEGRSTPIKYAPSPGSVAPLHAGASGKVLLAFMPEEEMAELLQKGKLLSVTPNTITDRDELKLRLRQIRKNGYDYSEGELVPETWALAFPILDPGGCACASLTIAGTLLNPPGPRLKILVEKMRGSVRGIETELWEEEGQEAGRRAPRTVIKIKDRTTALRSKG